MNKKDRLKNLKKIGVKLKIARIESNLLQQDVVKLTGFYKTFLSKVESGQRRIYPDEFAMLVSIYNKPLSYYIN